MSRIAALIRELSESPGCSVAPPAGVPELRAGHGLPGDVAEFYALAGGASLHAGSDYAFTVLPPSEVMPVSAVMSLRLEHPDVSDSWYVIVRDSAYEYLSVDCRPGHAGRCYDNFHEMYPFEAPVIATSFEQLLSKLLAGGGDYPFYLEREFVPLGDGYAEEHP